MPRLVPLLLLAAVLLSGCAATPDADGADAAPGGSEGPIRVVASTDVYGDIVKQIGGSAVQVTSIVDDPSRDPHEYEATPRDQLAVSRAQLVVVNGGGYDDFFQRLLAIVPDSTQVLDATKESGLDPDPADGEFNEHLWYDLEAVSTIATAVADRLSSIDPDGRAAFASGLKRFQERLQTLEDRVAAMRRSTLGKGVAIIEPVPLHLTEALGLVNRTPAEFSEAVEQGDDVAPAVLQEQLDLIRDRRVALLAYNEQTSDATTQRVMQVAREAHVPIVPVRETLPEGKDYLQWISADLDAIDAATG